MVLSETIKANCDSLFDPTPGRTVSLPQHKNICAISYLSTEEATCIYLISETPNQMKDGLHHVRTEGGYFHTLGSKFVRILGYDFFPPLF